MRSHVLELMHTSLARWNTAAAEGTEWRSTTLLTEAFTRSIQRDAVPVTDPSPQPDDPLRDEQEEAWRLFIRRPETYRAEFDVGDERVEAVVKGRWWWSWSPSGGARTNDGRENYHHGLGVGEVLFRPADILAALHFDNPGTAQEIAGRPSFDVRAVPVEVNERTPYDGEADYVKSRLHGIGAGADEYRLCVDAETGILLRAQALLKGRPFRLLTITSLSLDRRLDDEIFHIDPPDGRPFVSA